MSGGYAVLDPAVPVRERAGVCALAVMAKAPRPGRVKTRLQPPLTADEAAALNVCFLRDTTQNIAAVTGTGGATMVSEMASEMPSRVGSEVPSGAASAVAARAAAGLVCYTPVGDEAAFAGLLPEGFALIAQRGDGFGERLLGAAEDILACGFGAVCLIDGDSPTLPAEALRSAVEALGRPGDRVVLGPSEDGGYYLIGLKRAHAAPFHGIAWSTETVYAETVRGVRGAGLELVELPVWYDVDDAASLAVLEAELLEGQRPAFAREAGYDAVWTRNFLQARRARQDSKLGAAVGATPA